MLSLTVKGRPWVFKRLRDKRKSTIPNDFPLQEMIPSDFFSNTQWVGFSSVKLTSMMFEYYFNNNNINYILNL